MKDVIEEIKKRIDIVDFIGGFIPLKKTGRNFKALCPFHQEKTPSFIVSPERQIWHCFGACNEGGDVIKFLMKWENITFFEALKELAKKAGVVIKQVDFQDKAWQQKKRFLEMNQTALDFFQFVLFKSPYGKKALDYLWQRKIKSKTIKTFGLGYAPLSWDSLFLFLRKKKYEVEEMLANGLLVKNEKGKVYDRFRGRLIFPLFDHRGNVIGFSGRSLVDDEKEAKYINTPETLLYHKRETLFGLHLAKEAIKKENNVYIVEGEFDAISPFQAGFSNFVAIKGSALTKEQLIILKRFTERVTLVLDNDASGQEAVKRAIGEAEGFDFDINVVVFNFAKDPDEAVKKDIEKFKKIIKKPIGVYDFLIDLVFKKYPEKTAYDKKKISSELIPYFAEIKNNIVQSHYVKKLALLLDVSEQSIDNLIRQHLFRKARQTQFLPIKKSKTYSHINLLERYLLSLIFQNQSPFLISDLVFSIISPSDFSTPSLEKIAKKLFEFKKINKDFILKKFIKFLPEELRMSFDEVYLFASIDVDLKKESIEKIAYQLKKHSLKNQIKKILKEENQDLYRKKLKSLNDELKKVEKKLFSL